MEQHLWKCQEVIVSAFKPEKFHPTWIKENRHSNCLSVCLFGWSWLISGQIVYFRIWSPSTSCSLHWMLHANLPSITTCQISLLIKKEFAEVRSFFAVHYLSNKKMKIPNKSIHCVRIKKIRCSYSKIMHTPIKYLLILQFFTFEKK